MRESAPSTKKGSKNRGELRKINSVQYTVLIPAMSLFLWLYNDPFIMGIKITPPPNFEFFYNLLQDRIPTPTDGETLPSPYPMKLAPSDKREEAPDTQNIRVETCMFMVKLPRYTSYEKMKDKLLFAINSAFDPLSG